MTVQNALESFLSNDEDFLAGMIASTKAGFGGSSYSVELLEDGRYQVLWANQIGNKYNSPGVILEIPQFNDEEAQVIDTEDENQLTMGSDYETAKTFMRESLGDAESMVA